MPKKLSRCQTSTPIPDPNDPDSFRKDEFSAGAYDLTLDDDGTLTVKGGVLTVLTSVAWYVEAEAPAVQSKPVTPAKPVAKKGGR